MKEFSITNPHPGYLRGMSIVYPVLMRCYKANLLKITEEPKPGRISREPAGHYMFKVEKGHVLKAELVYKEDTIFSSEDVDQISYTVPCAGLFIFGNDRHMEQSVRPEWVVSFLLEEVK